MFNTIESRCRRTLCVSKIGNCYVIQHEKDVEGGCVNPNVLYMASGFCFMIKFPPGP
jgi:hypothetical protein